ncbi:MAG: hypothetical protein DLM72_16880 [Candidatus Nitrosopolaris wilkensis]|nr:MAG: hypothetical protein DLM72_16880 [Candidatus Nitrosopolaris wilkensis]
MFNVIKYLIYLFIEINNKFKYIYNCVHIMMDYVSGSKADNWLNDISIKRGTFGKAFKQKR